MASPPFSIAETIPADDDFASQFPGTERTFRDIVESWLLVEGNTSGRSNKRAFDHQGSTPSGVADVTTVWADDDGYLMFRRGTGNAMYLETPPGTISFTAVETADEGHLLCYGQNVSRTTYARLFARIGTRFGAGDGSTTFGLPDGRDRVVAGYGSMGGSAANRLTGLSGGVEGDVFGSAGGAESHALTTAQLAVHSHTATQESHTHSIIGFAANANIQGGSPGLSILASSGTAAPTLSNAQPAITVANAGSGAAHNNVQPTIIMNMQIKY